MDLNAIIGSDAHWQVNKKIAIHFKSNDTALLLADFISKQTYFEIKDQLTDDGFFYNTMEDIEQSTNITRHGQEQAIKALKNEGFLIMKRKGMPAKRYFKVNKEIIIAFLLNKTNSLLNFSNQVCENSANKYAENQQSCMQEISKHDCENSAINNNKENNNKNDNKENKVQKFSLNDFRNFFLSRGVDPQHLEDWIIARKAKRGVFTATVCKSFEKKIEDYKMPLSVMIESCAKWGWLDFKLEWYQNKVGQQTTAPAPNQNPNFNR